jgi:hypothetical protein
LALDHKLNGNRLWHRRGRRGKESSDTGKLFDLDEFLKSIAIEVVKLDTFTSPKECRTQRSRFAAF